MKKFFALAAVAALAMSANAQSLYITGDAAEGVFPANWAPETPGEFQVVDGNYVFEAEGLVQFKISTVSGDWDTFNSAALTCNYGDEPGAVVALEAGDSNIMCPWKGDYKIVVAGDLSTITLTTDTPNPGPQPISLYFRGDMNGWGADEAWKLEQQGDSHIFKFVCADDQKVGTAEAFKIADDSWGKYNFGFNEPILLEVETEIHGGSNPANITLDEEWNGVCWFDLDNLYIAFSNDKEYVPEFVGNNAVDEISVANEAPVYFNLQGVKVANPANGIYVVVKGGKAYKTVVK